MEEEQNKMQIIKPTSYDVQLRDFEGGLVTFLE